MNDTNLTAIWNRFGQKIMKILKDSKTSMYPPVIIKENGSYSIEFYKWGAAWRITLSKKADFKKSKIQINSDLKEEKNKI